LKDLKDRVAWTIVKFQEKTGLTDPQAGKILGSNKNTIAAYRKKGGLIKGEVLEKLISNPHFKFNSEWLMKGQGEPFPGARENYPQVCGPEEITGMRALPDETRDDFVFIPQSGNDRISAGRGYVPYNLFETQIAFRKDWIKRKGDPQNMSLIRVAGDSMEPTFLAGDLVLIDHKRNRIDPQGGIYALSINDEIMIKRIQVLYPHRKLKIISDNSKYEPIEVELDQVEINGKVIWFAREIER